MGIEHSCHACGCALGRIQAPPDPLYGLRVVVCPDCRTPCVRRRPEAAEFYRSMQRWLAAIVGMLWRTIGWGALILGTFVLSDLLVDSLRGLHPTELAMHFLALAPIPEEIAAWREDNGMIRLVVWAGLFAFIGAATTAGPAHLRPWVSWSVFIGALVAAAAAYLTIRVLDRATHIPSHFNAWSTTKAEWRMVRPTLEYVVAGLVFMPLGITFGRAFRRSNPRRESRQWLKKLARARKRRLAA